MLSREIRSGPTPIALANMTSPCYPDLVVSRSYPLKYRLCLSGRNQVPGMALGLRLASAPVPPLQLPSG